MASVSWRSRSGKGISVSALGAAPDQQGAHLGQRAAGKLAELLETLVGFAWVDRKQFGQHLCQQAGGEERLGDRIVQITRETVALDDHRFLGGLLCQGFFNPHTLVDLLLQLLIGLAQLEGAFVDALFQQFAVKGFLLVKLLLDLLLLVNIHDHA